MSWNFLFFANSILLGVGLAMDAFSVSIANTMANPRMGKAAMCGMAGVYALFQFVMPMAGWICVHTIVSYFEKFQAFIPWIALLLLGYIGITMLLEGLRGKQDGHAEYRALGIGTLLLQGIATSIDALSVGFTIAEYPAPMATTAAAIIAAVTFCICIAGGVIGKKAGTALAAKAPVLGGAILIGIGLEIVIKSFIV